MKKILILLLVLFVYKYSYTMKNINEVKIMEMHVAKYKYKYYPNKTDANIIVGKAAEPGEGFLIAPPVYEGKIIIEKNFNLGCIGCDEGTKTALQNITKELVKKGFENRLNIRGNISEGYSYEIITKDNPMFADILKDMLLTTAIRSSDTSYNSETFFFLREISTEVGKKYLENNWKNEQTKNELVNATLLIGGENIAEKNWKTLWRIKVIRSKPLTYKQKQWIKTFMTI